LQILEDSGKILVILVLCTILVIPVKLFADDTKVYAVVNKEEEEHSLQNDINNLVHWSDK
jgi:hypothetical protein